MTTIPERLTQLQIIENAEQAEREHVREALRRYLQAEYRREERSKVWRFIVSVATAFVLALAGLWWIARYL